MKVNKETEKHSYKLLGSHNEFKRGEIIQLTAEVAKSKIFNNKLIKIENSEESKKVLDSAANQAAKIVKDAEAQALKLTLETKRKTEEMLAATKRVIKETQGSKNKEVLDKAVAEQSNKPAASEAKKG